jgi:hypothetical protein
MPQSVFAFNCPNPKCPLYIVLPRQSLLGEFDGQPRPAEDIWPIRYLCRSCGLASEVQAKAIHPKILETRDRNPLVQYIFSNGQPSSLVRISIYCKESEFFDAGRYNGEEAVKDVLAPSGFWSHEWGEPRWVSIEAFPW